MTNFSLSCFVKKILTQLLKKIHIDNHYKAIYKRNFALHVLFLANTGIWPILYSSVHHRPHFYLITHNTKYFPPPPTQVVVINYVVK